MTDYFIQKVDTKPKPKPAPKRLTPDKDGLIHFQDGRTLQADRKPTSAPVDVKGENPASAGLRAALAGHYGR